MLHEVAEDGPAFQQDEGFGCFLREGTQPLASSTAKNDTGRGRVIGGLIRFHNRRILARE